MNGAYIKKKIETVQYTLPVHLAPLLFYGDWSGIESDELEAVEKWLESKGNPCFVDMSEDSWFSHTNDFDDLEQHGCHLYGYCKATLTTRKQRPPETVGAFSVPLWRGFLTMKEEDMKIFKRSDFSELEMRYVLPSVLFFS